MPVLEERVFGSKISQKLERRIKTFSDLPVNKNLLRGTKKVLFVHIANFQ